MKKLTQNVLATWGERGHRWLNNLPKIVKILATKWNLKNLVPSTDLSFNYVLFTTQNNNPVVLKIGFDPKEVQQEANALHTFNGNGCIKLLDSDIAHGALLLEQASPGTSLKTLFPEQDSKATKITCELMKQLHAAPVKNKEQFPNINDWLQAFLKSRGQPNKHTQKAIKLAEDLLASSDNYVLLHGDLHHENILSHNNKWTAIDPKGVLGEQAYEAGAFIRNPVPELIDHPYFEQVTTTRIQLFAQYLGVEAQRIRDWAYVQAILCASGCTHTKQFLQVAQVLDNL